MSRWQLQGTGDFYARYRAYENYLRANAKDLGLSEVHVNEQLGRYAQGLQQKLQYEPQNKIDGSEVAKNPKEYGVGNNPNNVTTELKKATERLETLQNGLTPVAEKSEYQKALENSQLYNSTGRDSVTPPNSVDKLGRKKQTQILKEIEKLSKLAKDEEIADLKSRLKAFRGGNDQKLFSEALTQNVKSNATENKIGFNGNQNVEVNATENPQNKPQLPPDTNTGKGVDSAKTSSGTGNQGVNSAKTSLKDAANLKPEAEAASKESKGFMNAIKNAIKGKKGKVAIAAGAVAALGAGVYALFGSKGEENVEQAAMKAEPQQPEKTQPQKPESKTETPENLNQEKETQVVTNPQNQEKETQVVTNPQNQEEHQAKVNQQEETTPEKALVDVPKTETAAETESESAEGKVADEEYVIVKKGDSFWNLAKEHLIEKHKDESGYKPTNAEILELAMKFMEDNGYKLDENNYYPEPMLHPGVKLNLAM